MKILEKFKAYITAGGQKKIIYNFVVVVIICIIVLIAWDTFSPKAFIGSMDNKTDKVIEEKSASTKGENDDLEVQLKNILMQIKGVGAVEVMITYESGTEVVPASNITKSNQVTQENDSQGGTRTTTQENLSQNIITNNDTDNLIVLKEIQPQIRGVVVVAEGAEDIKIKTELIEAVRTVFQIPAYKVMVYEKNNAGGN